MQQLSADQEAVINHLVDHRINAQMAQHRAAMPQPAPPQASAPRPTARPLQPKPFLGDGTQDTRIWAATFRNYLQLTHTPESEAVSLVASYLQAGAEIWWQSLRTDAPRSWEAFEPMFVAQFNPLGGDVEARQQLLHFITRSGQSRLTAKQYITQFTALQLRIPDMTEAERMSLFMMGLSPAIRKQAGLDGSETLEAAKRKVQMAEDANRVYGSVLPSAAHPVRHSSSHSSAASVSASANVPMELGVREEWGWAQESAEPASTRDDTDRVAALERQLELLAFGLSASSRPAGSFGRGGRFAGRGRGGVGGWTPRGRSGPGTPSSGSRQLTPQEREQLFQNGGCFFCRKPNAGHIAIHCPMKQQKN